MTRLTPGESRFMGFSGNDAIGNLSNLIGPGGPALAQQQARQHVLAQEAARAIALALGNGINDNFSSDDEGFVFGGF
jgi:hypothetical protein